MLSPEFIQKMKSKLEIEQAEVEKKIADLLKPEEALDNPDNEDLAQEATDDYLEESVMAVHKNVLEKINDALLRVKDGTYGRCLECGAKISEENLEKEPWAEHCTVCRR
jgi:DnaK suppressor protein